jgi:hypothetical protein
MTKVLPALPKITEPDYGDMVHYAPPPGADQVTLCGKTDWIGETAGRPVTRRVTCNLCIWIVDHIHRHRKPRC